MTTRQDTIWTLEPHTEAKHRILESYLAGWFPVMASWEKKILYLDGFSGPGRYAGGEPGSPLIALGVLLNHPHFHRWQHRQFHFFFLEKDDDRSDNLRAELAAMFAGKPGGKPPNVHYTVVTTTFVDAAKEIIDSVGINGVAPTFAFIDPFGWGGLPLDLIRKLLKSPKCEVLVNFMLDGVNRWATAQNQLTIDARLRDLFDSADYRKAPAGGPGRHAYLVDLYKRQLGVGFKYVRSFEMVSRRGRPLYHLVYGTRHPKGLEVMKRAMWKVDPERGVRFSATEADMLPNLFSGQPVVGPLRDALRAQFAGTTVSIEEVSQFVNCETDFMADSHLKKITLKPMEKAGEITNVVGRRQGGSFPAGCRITFA